MLQRWPQEVDSVDQQQPEPTLRATNIHVISALDRAAAKNMLTIYFRILGSKLPSARVFRPKCKGWITDMTL